VSVAHAYPETEFYEYAAKNGFITNEKMEDGGGHQMAHIEYPGLPTDYVMEMVHRFYDEYYFRPKAAFACVEGDRQPRPAAALRRSQVVPEVARATQPAGKGIAQAAGASLPQPPAPARKTGNEFIKRGRRIAHALISFAVQRMS